MTCGCEKIVRLLRYCRTRRFPHWPPGDGWFRSVAVGATPLGRSSATRAESKDAACQYIDVGLHLGLVHGVACLADAALHRDVRVTKPLRRRILQFPKI